VPHRTRRAVQIRECTRTRRRTQRSWSDVPARPSAFKPDFILISAGFDAMRHDDLGVFDVTPQGFAAIA
jgi:acetoin utilization deacetylase AcuC-like enzyme